jgi:hypothetical protein
MAGIETAQVAIIENVEIHRLRDIFFQCFFFPSPGRSTLTSPAKGATAPPPSPKEHTRKR